VTTLVFLISSSHHNKTRMLCGASAHDKPIPIGAEEKSCALDHLEKHYTFVATTER